MTTTRTGRIALAAALAAITLGTDAQALQRGRGAERPSGRDKGSQEDVIQPQTEAQIAWFGRWEDAAAEAERTGRPILLMSAAPQCQQVPGIW